MFFPRLALVLAIFISLVVVAPAQAAPNALNVLVTGNSGGVPETLATAIAAQPGVASVTAFGTSTDTPSAVSLASYDLVVSLGDSNYSDRAAWGDRLADFADAGGAVLQAAYDNWDNALASPGGRFESGGYAPLLVGPNDNVSVTLGTIVVPNNPLVQGLGTFPNSDNTTTPLAPGATLLAKWSDDRNAIAFKNRVAATSASADEAMAIPDLARLARNTGNYLGRRNVTIAKTGTGTGTVDGGSSGILCGASCAKVLPFGTSVTFTATPGPNSQFKGWSGTCTGTGACASTVAGSDITVGAVFDLARFGPKTLVTLSSTSSRIRSTGKVKIRIRNKNNFSVKGSLSGSGAGKKLKSKSFTLRAKGSKTVQVTLPKSLQEVLANKGKLKLSFKAKLKDPAGTSRTVKKTVTVKLKT